MKLTLFLLTCFFALGGPVFAQKPAGKDHSAFTQNKIYEANKNIQDNQFSDAEYNYKKAIANDTANATAKYNLGSAYLKNKNFDESSYELGQAAKSAPTKSERHQIYHNMGNAFMGKKDYANAVKAYQAALINNSEDEQTRYNYALAKELLKNQEKKNKDKKDDKKDPNKDKKKDDKKDDKNKNKDNENKDKDKKDPDKNKQQDDRKNPEKPKDEKENPSPQRQSQLNPNQVENILNAIENKERNVQEKVNAQKVKGSPLKQEKDW